MNLPYFDLTGKIAVVSGGATGLGLGMSEALAEAGLLHNSGRDAVKDNWSIWSLRIHLLCFPSAG